MLTTISQLLGLFQKTTFFLCVVLYKKEVTWPSDMYCARLSVSCKMLFSFKVPHSIIKPLRNPSVAPPGNLMVVFGTVSINKRRK